EPLLPAQRPWSGRPRRDHRQVVEGIIYRYRCGIAWRDVPHDFGPWQTVWKRHRAWAADGTWERILDALLVRADAGGGRQRWVALGRRRRRGHQPGSNLGRTPGCAVQRRESARAASWPRPRWLPRRGLEQDPAARRRPRRASGDPVRARRGRGLP